jgi:penicillin-binding protein 1B
VIVLRQKSAASSSELPGRSNANRRAAIHRILKITFHLALVTGILIGLITLYYFVKFSAIVDARFNGDIFRQSAKIYAAVPGFEQQIRGAKTASISHPAASKDASYMASFFDVTRARRRFVEFRDIPKILVKGVLSGEDRNFFSHYGVNPRRIAGAMLSNFKQPGHLQGASTITQQLARSLFLSREVTLRRKLSEAFISIILESRLTKEQIFTMYANEVYLGHRDSFAIHGFAEASKAYFGKELRDLSLAEAATIAGIIPAPNAYSPVHHPDRALARRDLILRIMAESGDITDQQAEEARRAPLKIASNVDPTEGQYLIDYIREELLKDFSEEMLMSGGLSVHTTVDQKLQQIASDAVKNGLMLVNTELAKRRGESRKQSKSPQAGLIALDPATGEIKAMVGGTEYGASQYNRITKAFRQPGSIFKPFVYAAALETARDGLEVDFNPDDEDRAARISPLTTLLDEPTVFYSRDKGYAPRNYGGQYYGTVTLRTAFQHSLNIPTVMLAQQIGYDRVVSMARRMGLNPQIRGYPSVALGAFEVTPLEIAGAYTAFANSGQRVQPHAVRDVVSYDGHALKTYQPQRQNVLSPQLAYVMTHLMEEVINQGTGAGVRARGFALPAAGKTGTSRDGWFAGYTKDLLVLAWVGFDDGSDLNLEGARSALPIWADFMKKAYALYPPRNPADLQFIPPPGVEVVRIDAATLLRGDAECGDSFYEAFIAGTAPVDSCLDATLESDPKVLAGSIEDARTRRNAFVNR